MGSSKNKQNSKRKAKPKVSKKSASNQKIDAKMLAIVLVFILLFVSYVVIFAGQDDPNLPKNMVFSQDPEELDTYYGNVKDINEELSDIKVTIFDSNADSKNRTESLVDGTIIETQGNFNCTFFDKNSNGKLDSDDEFIVHNASIGDWVKIYKKSSDTEIAFYQFR